MKMIDGIIGFSMMCCLFFGCSVGEEDINEMPKTSRAQVVEQEMVENKENDEIRIARVAQRDIIRNNFTREAKKIKEESCLEITVNETDVCSLSGTGTVEDCMIDREVIYPPVCTMEKDIHIKTPDAVKSIYYTSYAGGVKDKVDRLIYMAKNSEINSVIIDIKNVSGYASYYMTEYEFGKIKTEGGSRIKDIDGLIERLHKEGIYVIGRVVVFKDKRLAEQRPDLAIKWQGTNDVWNDYQGNKYLDPNAREVWDYIVDISSAAYERGFDEINYDYIRFPSDGKISKTYYPHSKGSFASNPTYSKIVVIDKFSSYVTTKLRAKYPDIVLSADIFGLVTNMDLFQIGQNLESFLIHYDYVGPMIYPSHYATNFLGYYQPDNYPFAVFQDALKHTSKRIDTLNTEIELAKTEGKKLKIKGVFETDVILSDVGIIPKTRIRPWLQGFTCTWCPGATEYSRTKFREQIRAIEAAGLDGWFVRNSASNYYLEWYNK